MKTQVNSIQSHHVLNCEGETRQTYEYVLIREEPLLIRVEGKAYPLLWIQTS